MKKHRNRRNLTILRPDNCIGLRRRLGWSQVRLAHEADVATSSVTEFERGIRIPYAFTLSRIKAALLDAIAKLERPTGRDHAC